MLNPASDVRDVPEVPLPSSCQAAASDTSCAPEGSEETICCRVCLEDGSEKDMVAPCCCSGTLKWAHAACIQKWINEKGDKHCEICRHSYSGDYSSPLHPPVAGPQVPLLAPFRGIMLPSQYLIVPEARASGREDVGEGDEGAQTSAAWCLSAVLLFMSMLLLRQAFEPPLGGREPAPGPSAGGETLQPFAMGSSLVYPTMPAEALTTPFPASHNSTSSQEQGGPVLAWIALKLIIIVLPFCILLRIVTIVRDVHLRHSQNAAAEHRLGAVLWNMEAGLPDAQHDSGQQQGAGAAPDQHARAAQFLPFSVAVC